MAGALRKAGVFLAGLFVGGAVSAWLVLTFQEQLQPEPAAATDARAPAEPPSRPAMQTEPAGTKPRPVAVPAPESVPQASVAAPARQCSFAPALAPSGPQDGRFTVDAVFAHRGPAKPGAYVAVAREAAGQQRSRDTEVALIVACRLAGQMGASPSVVLADVQAQLGQHYAEVAAQQGSDETRAQVLARARELLHDSAAGYRAVLGSSASKARLAVQRLAALTRTEAGEDTTVLGAAQGAVDLQREQAQVLEGAWGTSVIGKAAACASARSTADRIVCSDPDLAQLDSDLRRLRSQAASVSSDPAGLRSRVEQARAQRDLACKDRDCLLSWYAQRRRELLGEF